MKNIDELSSDDLRTRTTWYDETEVEKLREDPMNLVYDHDAQVRQLEDHEKLTCQQARDMGSTIQQAYMDLRKQDPSLSDGRIRELLLERNPVWSAYALRSHRMIFTALTNRATDKRKLGIMCHLVDIRAQVERGEMDQEEASAQVQDYLLQQCQQRV